MPSPRNRREFLKSSALGIATLRSTTVLGESIGAVPSNPAGPLSVWITEGNRRLEKQPASKWENSHGAPRAESIAIDPTKPYQPILGFGAAFTDAACYTFNRLDPGVLETLFHELFHPSEMGLSVCRTCVGSSDYSTEAFTYNEGDPDPDLKRFSIEHDRPYVLPILRQARKTNPDLFLFSSPWTPPGWMKSNKSMLGGNMQRHYMASYRSPLNEQLRDAATRNWPVFRQTLLLPTGHYPYATVQILSNGLPATQDHGPHSSLKSAKVRHIWPTRDPAYISTLSCRTNAFATRALGEHGEGLLTPILCGERERTRLAELR